METESARATLLRLKAAVATAVEARRQDLIDVSLEIHRNPELLFQEFAASKLLAGRLSAAGFDVELGAFGLETAFRATCGLTGPRVAIMAEYDAVPGVGHGCGHNVIAAAALGAGAALASLGKDLPGTVVVFGAPAEEGGNGKQLMAERGAFEHLEAAMMIHPLDADFAFRDSLAITLGEVEFFGRSAHGAMPEKGINALDALLVALNAFNATKLVLPTGRFNAGIITKGGAWVANVPDHTAAQFLLTGTTDGELRNSIEQLERCCKAGAAATGARFELRCDWDNRYRAMYSNRVLGHCFDENMRGIRPGWETPAPGVAPPFGATDMGSVSQLLPSIHEWIAIAPGETPWHSAESAAAAASTLGHRAVIEGAKAMAMTALDVMVGPDVLRRAREEWANDRRFRPGPA